MRYFYMWLALNSMKITEKRTLLNDEDSIKYAFNKEGRFKNLDYFKRMEDSYLKEGIKILTPLDEEYNFAFKEYDHRPIVIYAKGNTSLLKIKGYAVVGSRKCNSYGEYVTREIVCELVKKNEVVVSGGAYGVDTIAHKTALQNNGKTICVLGSGFNKLYPSCNKNLFNEIKERGLLLSEYPINMGPRKYFFPERNRIIAMLSKKVVVTQASEKSGSLITATLALDIGCDVLAVPCNITEVEYSGTNQLIQMGASIITKREDLF